MHESPRRGCSFRFRASLSLSLLILQSVSAENIVSRPVGFLRFIAPSNTQVLVSKPFAEVSETNDQPVLRWDASSGYTSTATAVEPGEGFWLINQASTNHAIFLAGEVVLSESNTALLYPGLNLVGYPYSSSVRLDETELWKLTNSVRVLTSEATQPDPAEVAMGKGYWVKSLAEQCIVWTEVRPYENVFPESGLPDIESITTGNGDAVILSIACAGDETFEVFYQDLNPTSRFLAARNWLVAESEIAANGQSSIEWVDQGSDTRRAPGEILGRYYLIGRGDIDLNSNGVPDAREWFVNGEDSSMYLSALFLNNVGVVQSMEEASNTNAVGAGETSTSTNNEPACAVSMGRVIYVDRKRGNDFFTGRAALIASGDGPKRTIGSGLRAAQPGDVMMIQEGQYGEDLNVIGRKISVSVKGQVNLCGTKKSEEKRPPAIGSVTNSQTGESHDESVQ